MVKYPWNLFGYYIVVLADTCVKLQSLTFRAKRELVYSVYFPFCKLKVDIREGFIERKALALGMWKKMHLWLLSFVRGRLRSVVKCSWIRKYAERCGWDRHLINVYCSTVSGGFMSFDRQLILLYKEKFCGEHRKENENILLYYI